MEQREAGGTLLVDLGNTRIKWAWLTEGGPDEFGAVDWEADGRESPVNAAGQAHPIVPHESTTAWRGSDTPPFPAEPAPRRLLFSPMSRPNGNARLALWVRQLWDVVAEAYPAEVHRDGLVNGYREPSRLGADRWWGMVAAWRRVRGAVMVVDAGTALTIDGVDDAGRHVVGYLQPGRELQARALESATGVSARPAPGAGPASGSPGDDDAVPARGAHGGLDTAGCIEAALSLAQAGLVEAAWRSFLARDPGARLLLTGGDHARLSAALEGLPVEVRPHLVLEGLAARAEDA